MVIFLCPVLLFPGVCGLSSSVPRQFHVVKEEKTWTEAQQYCREKFTDLATIDDMAEMEEIRNIIQGEGVGEAWIGLMYQSYSKWQWSLADRDFYGENETEFRNWDNHEPGIRGEICAILIRENLKWNNFPCGNTFPFVCFDGRDSTHPYVLVEDKKNWTDAQRYCREKHTDLASVRNQTENEMVSCVFGLHNEASIGLYRKSWEWSDGSNRSFRSWGPGEPDYVGVGNVGFCAKVNSTGLWGDEDCGQQAKFLCQKVPSDKDTNSESGAECGVSCRCE